MGNLAALQKAEQAMRNPQKRQQVMRWADIMLQKVAAVVQDLHDEKEGRRLAEAFQAPAMKAPAMRGQVTARSGPTTMFSEGDIGVLPPLGVWDPLGYIDSRDMRRYEEMGSTRRVASRPGPLRRPSSKHEVTCTRQRGASDQQSSLL